MLYARAKINPIIKINHFQEENVDRNICYNTVHTVNHFLPVELQTFFLENTDDRIFKMTR